MHALRIQGRVNTNDGKFFKPLRYSGMHYVTPTLKIKTSQRSVGTDCLCFERFSKQNAYGIGVLYRDAVSSPRWNPTFRRACCVHLQCISDFHPEDGGSTLL